MSILHQWYERSKVDYASLYVSLYISYNAWFQEVTGTKVTHISLRLLQGREVIWQDILEGPEGSRLRLSMKALQVDDWQSLIMAWHKVRCLIIHGTNYRLEVKTIKYAYVSLFIFMTEIIARLNIHSDKTLIGASPGVSVDMQQLRYLHR